MALEDFAGRTDFFRVEPGEPPWDIYVDFIDEAAHDPKLEQLIWDCTAFFDAHPEVDEAIREDRELIIVRLSNPEANLQGILENWWPDRIRRALTEVGGG
jgi:hypothetical protein